MSTVSYMLAAIVVGALISAQPPMNAILARHIGSALGATAISTGVAFISVLVSVLVLGGGDISRQTLASVPLWVFLAGAIGAVFVAAGVVIAPVTGALVFFVCIIAGQLIGSSLADHYGAFGLAVREMSVLRLSGILLVIGGAVLVGRG